MYRALLIILMLPLLLGQQYNVPFNPRAAAAGGAHIQDLFTTDSGADWTECGSWTITIDGSDSNYMDSDGASGASFHSTAMTTATSYGCMEVLDSSARYPGHMFRANSDGTNTSYALRNAANAAVVWRYCDCDSCTTIESSAQTLLDSDYLAYIVSGTGDATEVKWFVFANATGCTGCDGSDCDTSGWAGAARLTGTFTNNPPADAELSTNRYVGTYAGSSTGGRFDSFYAGDD